MQPSTRPSAGPNPGPVFGPGRGLLGVAVLLVLAWGLWSLRPGASRDSSGPEGTTEKPGSASADVSESGTERSPERGTGTRRRPFQRSSDAPALDRGIPWQSRIRTNGFLEGDRLADDLAYRRKAIQSNKLKTLLDSPARDTPECAQVIAFVERRGLPLAATVDLYNILWATRGHEDRRSQSTDPGTRDSIDLVQGMELSDFSRRFQTAFEVDAAPLLEDLFALGIRPRVFMGIPSVAFSGGEPLLSE